MPGSRRRADPRRHPKYRRRAGPSVRHDGRVRAGETPVGGGADPRHPDAAPPPGPRVREPTRLRGVPHLVGLHSEPHPPAHRHRHHVLARHRPAAVTPPSLLTLLTERETAAGLTVERLRAQIATLNEQLTTAETEVAELAITRKTLLSLGDPLDAAPPADPTIASPAYQQILTVFHTATTPMRAKDICQALGTGTTAKDTENLRAKLKRLVTRQILTEPEAGLFTLTPPST